MIGIPSPLFDELRGSLGGITCRQTQFGTVISSRAHQNSNSTAIALRAKSQLATANSLWYALSLDDQAAWASLRKTLLKNPANLKIAGKTSRQLYLSYALPFLNSGIEVPTDIPNPYANSRAVLAYASYQIGVGLTLGMESNATTPQDTVCWTSAFRPFKTHTTTPPYYKFITVDTEEPGSPWEAYGYFEAAFGTPALTEVLCFKGVCQEVGTIQTFTSYIEAFAYV